MSRLWRPAEESVARVRAEAARSLDPAEFERWVSAPMADVEREELLALIRWFQHRYPTPAGRLAYARRAAARFHPLGS